MQSHAKTAHHALGSFASACPATPARRVTPKPSLHIPKNLVNRPALFGRLARSDFVRPPGSRCPGPAVEMITTLANANGTFSSLRDPSFAAPISATNVAQANNRGSKQAAYYGTTSHCTALVSGPRGNASFMLREQPPRPWNPNSLPFLLSMWPWQTL